MKKRPPVLKELLAADRDRHVVAAFGIAYTVDMVHRGVEKMLRKLVVAQEVGNLSYFVHDLFTSLGIEMPEHIIPTTCE